MRTLLTATALTGLALTMPAQAQTELTYMMWGDPPELAVWQQIVEDFEALHPDISVSVEVSDWSSYWDRLRVTTVGGNAPDIFAMDAPIYPDWQSRGSLLDLTPYLEAEPTVLDGVYPGPLAAYQLEEGTFGLPRDFQTIVLYYNKAMFDAAGVAYPTDDWTLEDLRAAAKALTLDADGDGVTDQWGLSVELLDMEPMWGGVVYGYGGAPISDDHTKTLLAEGPAADAWTYLNGLALEDHSVMSAEDLESYGYDGFLAGVAAMTFSGHWVVPAYNELAFDWDVAPFPAGPAERATLVNSAGIVISSATEHPDEAWEFVKFVISEGGQSKLTELGFAIPVLEAVANSPVYLDQAAKGNHQVFLDALDYAHTKPSFKGYEEWSGIVGEELSMVWTEQQSIEDALANIPPAADDVLAANQ
ncbi:MAG: sugar ABC transporter substrate-binding protein [Candidatus Devosia phytovorans]|uniref:Sugar ABC transporter substrate-binding protein n=1 Tax=Candidatus Devosia phytovorans TaxID=3121372 RepID=A0AAJ5VS40_9HYPH|nr:sugar ABC transporter substrate-binding protein [Devosia sp.]WEK02910.1 MAG: sugar ABC transporter substrate-binding protein [Devosia sp.]